MAEGKELRAPRRVCIAGFMGAGKTTVARELARVLGRVMLDLDDFLTARTGRTPQKLIDEEGEAHFRELETDALREALDKSDASVLALGGGTWTLERNRALINARGCFTVWLDAPFHLCWQRIDGDNTRPFARDRARAQTLYNARRAAYTLADLRLDAGDDKSPAHLACAIADALRAEAARD